MAKTPQGERLPFGKDSTDVWQRQDMGSESKSQQVLRASVKGKCQGQVAASRPKSVVSQAMCRQAHTRLSASGKMGYAAMGVEMIEEREEESEEESAQARGEVLMLACKLAGSNDAC